MTLLVTGGAGFIGSNFVLDWLDQSDEAIVNLDALTDAGNLHNLDALDGDARHMFVRGDIGDRALHDRLLAEHRPRAVVHFAAESSGCSTIRTGSRACRAAPTATGSRRITAHVRPDPSARPKRR